MKTLVYLVMDKSSIILGMIPKAICVKESLDQLVLPVCRRQEWLGQGLSSVLRVLHAQNYQDIYTSFDNHLFIR